MKWYNVKGNMYNTLKRITKSLIPKSFLFKNELFFRSFYGILYKGKSHECNVCNKKLRTFIDSKKQDLLCPFCGSLSRSRRLWNLLQENNSLSGNILHFSPSRSIYRKLKKNKGLNYYSSDFENEFLADFKFDITNIEQPNEKFDTIICYHILEHIIDDQKGINELYRVLKPSGSAYIQTPFKVGDIYEDKSITSPKERLKHFGQEDHVRVYSIEGLKKRLEGSKFKVEIKEFYDDSAMDKYYGFKSPEKVLIVSK